MSIWGNIVSINPDFSQVFGCHDVAQALLPAASALLPTLRLDRVSPQRSSVEMSLDTAGKSACATFQEAMFAYEVPSVRG